MLTKKEREGLKQKFGGKCAYCGELLKDKWHADHIEPVIRKFDWVEENGTLKAKQTGEMHYPENNTKENLFPACIACNIHKSTGSVENFRTMLMQHIETLNRASSHSIYRHAKRFGLIKETIKPIVFHFEKAGE